MKKNKKHFTRVAVALMVVMFCSQWSLGLNTLRQVCHSVGQVEYLRNSGMLTALISKELCSCLFVQGMADRYPEVRGALNPQAIYECVQRAQIPFLNLILAHSRIQIEVWKEMGTSPGSPQAYLIETQARSPLADLLPSQEGGGVPQNLVLNRAQAVVHSEPRFGCRMQDNTMIESREKLPLLQSFPDKQGKQKVLTIVY